MINARSGRMLPGLNHVPFAQLPVWDVTPRGTLLLGSGQEYAIRDVDAAGRELRVYRRTVTPTRIPERERRDSTAALRARLDSVPVPLDRVQGMPPEVRALKLPEVYPPYMNVYAAPDGRVWVRRWPQGGGEVSIFDVFEASGRFSAVVVLPRMISGTVTPVLSLRGIAAIGVDSETGANTVLQFVPDR